MSLQNAYTRLNTKWSSMLGAPHTHYRPTGGMNPLNTLTSLGQINALFDASISLEFNAPSKYNNPLFALICNPTVVQPLDYLKGPQGTFFIASTEPLKPILCVQCPRVATFLRPNPDAPAPPVSYGSAAVAGRPFYNGDTGSSRAILMQNVPISILNGTKGERNAAEQVPTDSRLPWANVLVPAFPGVILREADRMTDDTGRNFVLSSCELTDLGWRLTAELVDV